MEGNHGEIIQKPNKKVCLTDELASSCLPSRKRLSVFRHKVITFTFISTQISDLSLTVELQVCMCVCQMTIARAALLSSTLQRQQQHNEEKQIGQGKANNNDVRMLIINHPCLFKKPVRVCHCVCVFSIPVMYE